MSQRKKKGEFIVERNYVDDQRIIEPEKLEIGGVDMSGRWGLLVLPRTIEDFDHSLHAMVKNHPRGRNIDRCWQCGNCTAACPVAEENPLFNPRYLIYIIKLGYKLEIEKFGNYVYFCGSCGRCSEVCPKDVDPSGVMEAIGTALRRKP
ncbi:MAG: 4Fe-4S dicluster domain-containing protein [Thaumarchaeota archaeon]|nr:4Fe-4S dicluster domain-containing protein [Candidatus Calditenuaceae archaeon]MDW8041559.1 4Fe-4S dicluster domain-containing protein [Nitrososphaerota archaeon]